MARQSKETPEWRERARMTGERIRHARQEMGFDQQQFRALLGWSRSGLSDLELGRNSVDAHDLWRIAQITGYSVEYFVNPDYEPALTRAPRNMEDWDALYPGDHGRARAHFDLDRAWQARPALDQ